MTRPIFRMLLAFLVVVPLGCGSNDAAPTAPVLQDLKLTCSAAPISGPAPLLVQFFATPTGGNGVHAVSWSFGDGGSSNDANPARLYTRVGSYNASVEVNSGAYKANCSVAAITVQTPTLKPNSPPRLSFKLNPSPATGTKPFVVELNGCPSSDPEGDPILFIFDVGDGRRREATYCRREHTYETAGTFQASLCITDGYPGHSEVCDSHTVTVR
jgi:large repetitive protein